MGVTYKAILWNKQKRRYDATLWLGIVLALSVFVGVSYWQHPTVTYETIIIRAAAFVAILLLHVILLIGPLSRLDARFLPLLYNRRHLGVSMFLIALIHGGFSIMQFHSAGDTHPLVSVFTSNQHYESISQFPFQILGFFALCILFLMAITSHDFWLHNLSPRIWKTLHTFVYVAYGLVILHVALGTLQYENTPIYKILLWSSFMLVCGLHIWAGIKENRRLTAQKNVLQENGFYQVGNIDEIEEKAAKTVFVNGQNVAIFKYDGKIAAVHNVCRHQLGPLGEGKIIDGCITCPWHGYQYLPENGQSPPPFHEKLNTYQIKLVGNKIWLNPTPFEEGTYVEPAVIFDKNSHSIEP